MEIIRRFAASVLDKGDVKIPQGDVNQGTLESILTIVFGIAGAVSVIMIIMGGITFVMSKGDPKAAAKGRNTIIYAAVGLAISLGAFTIVQFVVDKL